MQPKEYFGAWNNPHRHVWSGTHYSNNCFGWLVFASFNFVCPSLERRHQSAQSFTPATYLQSNGFKFTLFGFYFFVTVSKTLARVERVENFPPPAFAGHRCISQIMDFTVPEKLKEREMVVKYRSKSGKARFHGGSQLKSSQSYPAGSMAANKC